MSLTPLFTRDELGSAFALLFEERTTAERLADTWFSQFADEVDEHGRFLYDDWNDDTQRAGPAVVSAAPSPADTAEVREHEARYFGGWSEEKKAELVLRFSDFHLGLVALVSPALYERMRLVRRMTPEGAARNRAQMEHIARALRG